MTDLRPYLARTADLRSGKTTPNAYLEETIDRIAKREPVIGAFVVLGLAAARKAAEASTARWKAGKPLSPVDGMPIAIKDIIETADMPTGQGSPIFEGTSGRRDSATVFALREDACATTTAPARLTAWRCPTTPAPT